MISITAGTYTQSFTLDDITWELSTTANLDAEQNLRTALAAAWRPAPYTAVRFGQPISRGSDSTAITSFTDEVQCNDGPHIRNNIIIARLTYFELNATAVIRLFLPLVRR